MAYLLAKTQLTAFGAFLHGILSPERVPAREHSYGFTQHTQMAKVSYQPRPQNSVPTKRVEKRCDHTMHLWVMMEGIVKGRHDGKNPSSPGELVTVQEPLES